MPPPRKKIAGVTAPGKRMTITLEGKLNVLAKYDSRGPKSVKDLALELGLKNASTLYTIIKNRKKIEEAAMNAGNRVKKRMRVRSGKYVVIENELVEWLRQARARKIPVSGPLLCLRAEQLAKKHGVSNFQASSGWLTRFRHRHNVLFKKLHGESADVDMVTVNTWKRNMLPKKIAGYQPQDVYNADELGLYFNLLPGGSMVLSKDDDHGGKASKARLTVLLAANADGSDKLPPLVIGKSANPRCFRGVRTLPCTYKSQVKAWMTGAEFINWLKQVDGRMRARRRNVLLFIDNCPAHPVDLQFLTNIRVEFFPKNCTSILQPLDQGVIHNFKYFYRKRLILRLLNVVEKATVTKKDMLIDVLHALHYLQWAWEQVTPQTIANCFRHAGFNFELQPGEPTQRSVAATPAASSSRSRRSQDRGNSREDDLLEQLEDDPDEVGSDAAGNSDADGDGDGGDGTQGDVHDASEDEQEGASEDEEDAENVVILEIEEELEESWRVVTEKMGIEHATIEEFVCVDDDVPICESLTDDDFMNKLPDESSEANDEETVAAEGVEPEIISQAEGLQALSVVRKFVSQLGVDPETFTLVSKLETLAISLTTKARKQSKISDFFVKS